MPKKPHPPVSVAKPVDDSATAAAVDEHQGVPEYIADKKPEGTESVKPQKTKKQKTRVVEVAEPYAETDVASSGQKDRMSGSGRLDLDFLSGLCHGGASASLDVRLERWMNHIDSRFDTLQEELGKHMQARQKSASQKKTTGTIYSHGLPLLERKTHGTRLSSPLTNDHDKDNHKDMHHEFLPRHLTLSSAARRKGDFVSDLKAIGRDVRRIVTHGLQRLGGGQICDGEVESEAVANAGKPDHQVVAHSKSTERKETSKRSLLARTFDRKNSFLSHVIRSKYFDFLAILVVLLNSVVIGAQVHFKAKEDGDAERVLGDIELGCAIAFTVELVLRIWAETLQLLLQVGERPWFFLDLFLVLLFLVEVLLNGIKLQSDGFFQAMVAGRLLKVLRIARIMRILRMLRFLAEMRVMVTMILKSMVSLFWLFLLLLLLIYGFSILLTQGATEFLQDPSESGSQHRSSLREAYGDLFTTMYTLYKSITGGVSWGEVSDPLVHTNTAFLAAFLIYIFFSVFSVLNIVTGVFVDGAIELANQDRALIMQKMAMEKSASARNLRELLSEMDQDGDSIITYDEFMAGVHRLEVRQFMEAMQVNPAEADVLFGLLDMDCNGSVDVDEFVTGMLKVKGEAKNFDIQVLLMQNQRLMTICVEYLRLLKDEGFGL